MKTLHLANCIVWMVIGLAAPLNSANGKSIYSMESSASGQSADEVEDLGEINESTEKAVNFRANVNTHVDYTSNAQVSGNHGSGDVLFFPTVQGGMNAKLSKTVTFDLEAHVESVLYSRYDEQSMAGYGATATLDWRPKPNLPRIYVGAEPYRYDSFDNGDLITQAVGVNLGTDWGVSFNQGNSLAFVGFSFSHYYTDPGIDTRNVSKTVLGLTHQIRPQLSGQIVYSHQYSDFEEVDRRDSRHIVILGVTYEFNPHLFGNVSGNFVDNDSTQNRASYQSAGASLGLTWNF